jgi:hypothetical protein
MAANKYNIENRASRDQVPEGNHTLKTEKIQYLKILQEWHVQEGNKKSKTKAIPKKNSLQLFGMANQVVIGDANK